MLTGERSDRQEHDCTRRSWPSQLDESLCATVLAVAATVISEALLGFAILATAHGSVVKIVGGVIIIIAARGAWLYERRRRQRD